MKRVLFVQTATELGGSERNVLGLLSTDAVRPHATLALCADEGGFVGGRARELGISTRQFFGSRLRQPLAILDLASALARFAQRQSADAICARGTHPFIIASIASRLARLPAVFLANMIYTDDHKRAAWTDQIALRMPMDLAFANSRASEIAFAKHRPRVPTRLLHPGSAPIDVADEDIARVRAIVGGKKIVGVFGRLQAWKGQDVFIEAMAQVEGAHFVVVGDSTFGLEPEFKERLVARAEALSLPVHFAGFQDPVAPWMAACDVVCHTSRVPEPFGMVVLEAMGQGRAVIATDGGGPSDMIEDGVHGRLIAPDDPARLAVVVRELLNDDSAREAMGRRAQARALNAFSHTAMGENFVAGLESHL